MLERVLIDGKPALRIVGGIWIRAARQPIGPAASQPGSSG
jgi:hypothetical protein